MKSNLITRSSNSSVQTSMFKTIAQLLTIPSQMDMLRLWIRLLRISWRPGWSRPKELGLRSCSVYFGFIELPTWLPQEKHLFHWHLGQRQSIRLKSEFQPSVLNLLRKVRMKKYLGLNWIYWRKKSLNPVWEMQYISRGVKNITTLKSASENFSLEIWSWKSPRS